MTVGRSGAILWIRGHVFTLLAPCGVGVLVPFFISRHLARRSGLWAMGSIPVAVGATIYVVCLVQFLLAHGTPPIFFTRGVRFLIGEEPHVLVENGLYGMFRNPLYFGVSLVVFGQAVLLASATLALYGAAIWLCFHFTVVLLEEPHLRRVRGAAYDEYCPVAFRVGWAGIDRCRG